MKAEYKGRYQDRDNIFLLYEYRGVKYEVHENRAKGNEPLSWQHRSEQDQIDRRLDALQNNSTEPAHIGLDMFFKFFE